MSIGEIARRMKASRNTVREIVKQCGRAPESVRADKTRIDEELLIQLYTECKGWVQRVYEKLTQEHGISVGYSTLTRMIRQLGLDASSRNSRCARVADEPGAEMQHDTTVYKIWIGNVLTRVIASLLYFRYCKVRFLKFYRVFNRFRMKCFFHEALTHWGFSAGTCIIDNTSVARLRGTGKHALIVPEMEEFGRQYGFQFVCHELKHANRKAGEERSFWTVETNFFAGRSFQSWEDLNGQALNWSTVIMVNRPVSKTHLIPAKAFEFEKLYLTPLSPAIQPPYLVHHRGTDQYGYASFDGNFYWVPGTGRSDITVLEFSHRIKIYRNRELLVEYELPVDGLKNALIAPDGLPAPLYKPKARKRPTDAEEQKLRAMAGEVDAYLNFALAPKGITRHRFIRQLFSLSGKIAPSIFVAAIARALKYRISDLEAIERICLLCLRTSDQNIPAVAQVDEDVADRETYKEGSLSDDVDLSIYDKMFDDDEDNNG
jgi:transposase